MRLFRRPPLAAALVVLVPVVRAQTPAVPFAPGDTTDVRFSTPDSVITHLYGVISGPAGQARDWAFFRALFLPEGRLAVVGRRPNGAVAHRVLTPDEYVERSGPVLTERGFFETETHRTAERFGNVYHAFSTYESRTKADAAEPFARGINSIQLVRRNGRWWVLSVLWNDEAGAGEPVPERYRGH